MAEKKNPKPNRHDNPIGKPVDINKIQFANKPKSTKKSK